ncbi:hypothetical protein AGMMS49938_07620 [Fibrobacterales bacterium]|nr:hypothetical protein AGMMS49938_07620 [Fibrobacterales bacterium]
MNKIFCTILLITIPSVQAQKSVPVPVPAQSVSKVPITSQPAKVPIEENFTEDTSSIEGIRVPGKTLAEKLAWLQRRADSHNTYILEATANENIAPHIFEYKGAINITVILKGDAKNRTIRLTSNGTMFSVRRDVTFILDNNITLLGHRREVGSMIHISNGGAFVMNSGSAVTGNAETNSNTFGAGIYIENGGFFTMNGGVISDNTTGNKGGGVYVDGTFTMNGGTISGNAATSGGGVYVAGTFTMNNGTIIDNEAFRGGGVYNQYGGNSVSFNMLDGYIAGNTAKEYGGGVYVYGEWGAFTKKKGIITGYNNDEDNGNVVKDAEGILARRGHAVYIDEKRHKESTIDSDLKLDSRKNGAEGGWDL